jgi:hypothetical protein
MITFLCMTKKCSSLKNLRKHHKLTHSEIMTFLVTITHNVIILDVLDLLTRLVR